jgi:hypothetical protein
VFLNASLIACLLTTPRLIRANELNMQLMATVPALAVLACGVFCARWLWQRFFMRRRFKGYAGPLLIPHCILAA